MAKFQKLFKSEKSKSEKLKKLSKSENLPNFNAIKTKLSFLTFNAKMIFYYLRLAFTKTLIFCYFDLECHIWIETYVLGYIIDRMLNQLTFKTNLNKIVFKTNLD